MWIIEIYLSLSAAKQRNQGKWRFLSCTGIWVNQSLWFKGFSLKSSMMKGWTQYWMKNISENIVCAAIVRMQSKWDLGYSYSSDTQAKE